MAGIQDYQRGIGVTGYYDDVQEQRVGSPRGVPGTRRSRTAGGYDLYESEQYGYRGQIGDSASPSGRHQNLNLQFGHNNLPSAQSSPDEDEQDSTFTIHKGIGLLTVVGDNLLSHPFLVLRRQCQVHVQSRWYHLSPISLVGPVFHICQSQGCSVLWKGLGSSLLVRGMTMAVEDVTTKVTPWPKEINRHSSLKSVCQHILLKSISLAVITPFYSASLVESCQSEVASETAGFFDVFREGLWRVLSWPQTGRLVPLHVLVVPTVAHGILSYLIYTGIRSISLSTIKRVRESKERKQGALRKESSVSYYSEMTASLVGHMVADILLFPLETILHRLHLQGTRTIIDSLDCGIEVTPIITSYGGLIDCIRTTVEEEGVSGLYKGFGALIMQYGLQILIIRTVKIILEQTTFGQNNDIPKLKLDEKASMSQSVSEGNINRAVNESPNPRHQYSRDYSSAHNTPLGEPKLRSRFSNYNNPDLLNQ